MVATLYVDSMHGKMKFRCLQLYYAWKFDATKTIEIIKKYIFQSWMIDFAEHTIDLQKPILLIYVRQSSSMKYSTIATARGNDTVILCLILHTSQALQSLEIGMFARLNILKLKIKRYFKEVVSG